jgi:hypothetical protein
MKGARCVVASIEVTEQWFAFRYVVTPAHLLGRGL